MLVLAAAALGATAAWAQTDSTVATINLSARTSRPGGTLTAEGIGWRPNSVVSVSFTDGSPGSGNGPGTAVTVGSNGRFRTTIKIPDNAPLGFGTVKVKGLAAAGNSFIATADVGVGPTGMSYVQRSLLLGLIFLGGLLLIAGTVYVSNRLFSAAGSDKRAASKK